INEDAPINPGSPYGESKYMVERALYWADKIHGLKSACLRYFNAAGADPAGRAGEDHRPETHLIPLVIDAALKRRPALTLFGEDYPTPDGTCIRDYVHVTDLARAHLAVLPLLNDKSVVFNVGTGRGNSNREIIDA
ncbi:UDP-glucose 4-epimerase, partial [Acetobacter pomorum]